MYNKLTFYFKVIYRDDQFGSVKVQIDYWFELKNFEPKLVMIGFMPFN